MVKKILAVRTQLGKSGTGAATYLLTEPGCLFTSMGPEMNEPIGLGHTLLSLSCSLRSGYIFVSSTHMLISHMSALLFRIKLESILHTFIVTCCVGVVLPL